MRLAKRGGALEPSVSDLLLPTHINQLLFHHPWHTQGCQSSHLPKAFPLLPEFHTFETLGKKLCCDTDRESSEQGRASAEPSQQCRRIYVTAFGGIVAPFASLSFFRIWRMRRRIGSRGGRLRQLSCPSFRRHSSFCRNNLETWSWRLRSCPRSIPQVTKTMTLRYRGLESRQMRMMSSQTHGPW